LAAIASDQEPSYNGRLLSQWLGDLQLSQPGATATEGAVRAMGTNAIPALLKWISYERPLSQQSEDGPATAVPIAVERDRPLSPAERAVRSQYAFEFLGAVARPAIPELTRLARTSSAPERAERCAASLAFIGPEAIPSLLSLATNAPPCTRYHAIGVLESFYRDRAVASLVPVLISCLGDTNTDFPVDGPIERVFHAIGPAVVVPVLTNALRSASARIRQRAFLCLSEFEFEDPTNVPPTMVPTLRAAMRDPDSEVCRSATYILRRMGGWDLVGEQWVGRHGTNTLHGITPDFFTNAPPR
jgi:HEAT repeat protein